MKVVLFACLLLALGDARQVSNIKQNTDETAIENLADVFNEIVVEFQQAVTDVNADLQSFRDEMTELRQKVAEHDLITEQLLQALTSNTLVPVSKRINHHLSNANEVNYQYTAVGCKDTFIHLSCPEGRRITLVNATYGYYAFDCTSGCCPPSPSPDCTGYVNASYPEDWAYLVFTCANKTSCDYEHKGRNIDGCETADADYMQIFYGCYPLPDVAEPIGFTAYNTMAEFLPVEKILRFDEVVTNIGGHYNTETSSFVCPYEGVYFFNINFNSYNENAVGLAIVKDNVVLVKAYADRSDIITTGSAFVITECGPNQMVWVHSTAEGNVAGDNRRTHFNGYMLYAY